MALVGARVGWRWFAGAYWRALRWLALCWLALAGWRGSKNVGHSIGEECRLHRVCIYRNRMSFRYPGSHPTLPLPSQPASLFVTPPASQPFTQPASQPFRYPASQRGFPLPSQPHTFTSQPAYLTRKPTHRHLACLACLCTGGVLFLTLTVDQHGGGARLIRTECFESRVSRFVFC